MYGFIYITTNHINGKKYIGQKKYDKYDHWRTYLGSGILLSRAINKYGRENFSKEIIEECETRDKLNAREKYWISYYDAVNSDEFYNIASGGDGGRTCYGETHQRKSTSMIKTEIFLENGIMHKELLKNWAFVCPIFMLFAEIIMVLSRQEDISGLISHILKLIDTQEKG